MAIMSAVMKVRDDAKAKVLQELEKESGVSLEGESPAGELILLIEAENIHALHKKSTRAEKLDGVLGIYPSYITTADED